MSKHENELLLEKAAQLIDDTTGMSYIPERIEQLIKSNDLDELRVFCNEVEATLAIEHFHNADILDGRDEF